MGSEIEKITKLRRKISMIASPIRKRLNEISNKSRDMCDKSDKEEKDIAKLISKYSIPFRMMEKLKRNST